MKLSLDKYLLYFFIPLLMFSYIAGNAVIDIVVVFFSLTWILFYRNHFDKFNQDFKNTFYLIFIFYIGLIVSSFFSDYFQYSFLKSIIFIRFIFFGLFMYYIFNLKLKNLHNYLFPIIIILLFIYADTLLQFIFDAELFGYSKSLTFNRIAGPFGDEIILGSFIFIFASFVTLFNKNHNNFYLLFILISFIILIITKERIALIKFTSFHLIFFIIGLYTKKFKIKIRLLIPLFLFLLIIFSILFHRGHFDRHLQFVNKFVPDKTEFILYSGHYSHFVSSYLIFKDNPYTGSGIRTFRYECFRHKGYFSEDTIFNYEKINFEKSNTDNYNFLINKLNENMCNTHPHNLYLEILSEIGIIGFIPFIILMIYIYIKLYFFDLRLFFILYFFPFASTGSLFHNKNSFLFVFIIVLLFLIRDYRKNIK